MWVGRGQCIEHYGQEEACLPVLEALDRLCREADGKQLIDLLSQHAPTWLAQMPALLTTTELEALQRRPQGATRERMLRELAEAVAVLSAERPLALVFEDLHWSDVSTLDWLVFVARRREPARLLIIGVSRPVEVIINNHALKSVKQELHLHGQCEELSLRFLTEEAVAQYLTRRTETERKRDRVFTAARGSKEATGVPQLARLIHQRTEGNPLFMVNLVDYLVNQGVLAPIDGQWRLQGEVTAIESWAPESLQQLIEKQIERLSSQDRRVLEVAEQCLSLAQHVHNPIVPVGAHHLLGCTLYPLGEFALAREHWEAGIALYDSQPHRSALGDSGVLCLSYAAWVLWFLGYPDQALQRIRAALTLAQERSHPYSLAIALNYASELHHLRREVQAVQERAEALIALSTEQGVRSYWRWELYGGAGRWARRNRWRRGFPGYARAWPLTRLWGQSWDGRIFLPI